MSSSPPKPAGDKQRAPDGGPPVQRRLSENTATKLRQAVDQMRAVLALVSDTDTSVDDAQTLTKKISDSGMAHARKRTLDESDSYFCSTSLANAAAALERVLQGSDAAEQHERSGDADDNANGEGSPNGLDAATLPPPSFSHHPGIALQVPTGAVEAAAASVETTGADADDVASAPFASVPDAGAPTAPSQSSDSEEPVVVSPVSLGGLQGKTVMPIPSLAVQGATPLHSFRSQSGEADRRPDSGRSGRHLGVSGSTKDQKVIDENHAEDSNVAKWLNGTFADQHKRESTGFEMKLQRSNSIMSSAGALRANARDDDDDGSGLFAGSHILPDGSECIPTKYSRSNSRSYPAFCSERKYAAALRAAGVERVAGINDSDFDIFPHLRKHGAGVFTVICANVFLQYNFMNSLGINVTYFMNFLRELEKHYFLHNPYHNGAHAADVLQTTNVYLCTGDVKENFSDVELIAILFGAMAHDVGHPGTTNAFLQKARHPLARLYNDMSTLESMHAAMAFILLDKPECNFFETSKTWTRAHDADFRALAVEVILGTDMKHHAAMTTDVCDILEDGQIEDDEVARLFKAIVHAADLSNPMKPQHVYLNWMERVNAEFWQQGDEEKRRGMEVSVMCDRDKPNVFKSQVGFIEFVVRPFMQELAPVLPPIWIERLQKNLEYVKSGDPEEEAACVKRIQALSSKRWVDVPIRQHSFFTVVMRYFDAYRLSSQLAYNDGGAASPSGSAFGDSGSATFNAVGAAGGSPALGHFPGSMSGHLGASVLQSQLQSTIEVHHCRLAEECERWIHQISAYRPTFVLGPDGLTRRRRHSSLRSGGSPNGLISRDETGLSSPNNDANDEMPVLMAGPAGTSVQVSISLDRKPRDDDEFFERLCAAWLTTILELQLQLRLQGHQEIDDQRLASRAAGLFVPYLEEAAAEILLKSDEGEVLVRRRVEEDRRVTASHRTNHEAEIEERHQRRLSSIRQQQQQGQQEQEQAADAAADKPNAKRGSVSFAPEGRGTPRAGRALTALEEVLSDVGATDVSACTPPPEEDEDDGTQPRPTAAEDEEESDVDDDASRTFSWMKKKPKSERSAGSLGSTLNNSTTDRRQLPHSASGRLTLYQTIKRSEYIADEDLLLEVIRANPKLAVLAVDRIVRGESSPGESTRGGVPTAEQSRSVRVIEPPPSQSPRMSRKTGMVRFVNALTKSLVAAFGNHVKRSRDIERVRQRALSSATLEPAPSNPGSNAATIDAASVLNNTGVRDRTHRWLEDLYKDMESSDHSGGRRASGSTRTRSPAPTGTPQDTGINGGGSAGAAGTMDRLTAVDTYGNDSTTSSRRPSNRSELEHQPSHAGTEPHAFFTPDDKSLQAGAAAVLLGMANPSSPSNLSSASVHAQAPASPAGDTNTSSQKRATSPSPQGRPPRSPVSVSLAIPAAMTTASASASTDTVLFVDNGAPHGALLPPTVQATPGASSASQGVGSRRPKASNPSMAQLSSGPSPDRTSAPVAVGTPTNMLRKYSGTSSSAAGASTSTLPHSSSSPSCAVAPVLSAATPQPAGRPGALRTDSVLRYVNNARRLDTDRLSRAWEGRVLSFASSTADTKGAPEQGLLPLRAKSSADVRGSNARPQPVDARSVWSKSASDASAYAGTGTNLPRVKPGNRTPDPR